MPPRPPQASDDHVDRVRAQWARTRPDLDTAPLAVIARLGRAAAYIDAAIDAHLGQFGLSRASWDVVASLRRAGHPYRLSPTQLYRSLMRTSGAITHRLSVLEHDGLIRRAPDPEDGRSVLVELTCKGLQLVDRIAPLHLAAERQLLTSLGDAEQQTLAMVLRILLRRLEATNPTPPASGLGGRRNRTSRRPPP